ncbi:MULTISPECIES: hypothetical protein [Methanoculleus]|uniref:Uncharacterized protein n=2 Tax=Methanoculleus TaxID=45989 RepID=A3CS39_METMJ|nr:MULTISPECIES: hypothetical protein [Methanoculleus]ABN56189.1 hypothetical protein Memar_0255 [Methanoculleus marisnigri JR1]UYU17657.1 hypothetical protein OH143_08030 [Methanoculleus submarinus]
MKPPSPTGSEYPPTRSSPFSLRHGGDWSYAAEGFTAISAVTKTTVYDEMEHLAGLEVRGEGLRVFRFG